VGSQVRTRRWTWRQSEHGKIGPDTGYVFFPIDGFIGFNDGRVREAAAALETALKSSFGCVTVTGFVDREHPEMDITL
jgi:DNA/RNA-binding domain of Phe-tRNA-synthetase-like protein